MEPSLALLLIIDSFVDTVVDEYFLGIYRLRIGCLGVIMDFPLIWEIESWLSAVEVLRHISGKLFEDPNLKLGLDLNVVACSGMKGDLDPSQGIVC